MNLDLINAAFEIGGALAAAGNVATTYKAKRVVGVSKISTLWFSSWGAFNLVFYQNLGQTLSFYAAGIIAMINFVWLLQMFYYSKPKEVQDGKENEKSQTCSDCGAIIFGTGCCCQTEEKRQAC